MAIPSSVLPSPFTPKSAAFSTVSVLAPACSLGYSERLMGSGTGSVSGSVGASVLSSVGASPLSSGVSGVSGAVVAPSVVSVAGSSPRQAVKPRQRVRVKSAIRIRMLLRFIGVSFLMPRIGALANGHGKECFHGMLRRLVWHYYSIHTRKLQGLFVKYI